MRVIRELFAKDVSRPIEEIIKVDQHNEQVVLTELDEYVITDAIGDHFRDALQSIAEGPALKIEKTAFWVSGFFGAGKSSFAKILGYAVASRAVGGKSAAELFKINANDAKISAFLDSIATRVNTRLVMFDVSMDRGVRTANERMTEIIYKAMLRELDYAEDFDLARLEMDLETDGQLDTFTLEFKKLHGKPWADRRQLGFALNEASEVLHSMNPTRYPHTDSFAVAIGEGRADITPNKLAEMVFDLAERRAPGATLMFIVDEVGQYVARSEEKMLDLQGVVQAIGRESLNRVQAGTASAPVWLVVTSQEKLDEVVSALDSRKIQLAKIQDRFIPIDLKQTDITEVTGRRVLAKKSEAADLLGKVYDEHEGRLKSLCKLEHTSRDCAVTRKAFVNLYPYLPYQIELCIDIVAGLRLKRGAQRHIGGSNRTIIKQAQQMMINDNTNLAACEIGNLVTLDKVYELLYLGNLLPSESTREIDEVGKNLAGNDMALKVAKGIALLESVRDLPRTVHNLAVVLHPSVESDSIEKEVQQAVEALASAKFIRESDDGYKLLTVQEKGWDTKRGGLSPREADRNRITREVLQEIISDPKIKNYRFKNLRGFRCSLSVGDTPVETGGDFLLSTLIAGEQQEREDRSKEARKESSSNQNDIYWTVCFTEEIHRIVAELYRSREMITTHDHLAAQGKLTAEEVACLSEEKVKRDKVQRNLRTKMVEVFKAGTGYFRGVEKDGSALGDSLPAVLHAMFNYAIPQLYPKLEMGVRPLKGDEAEKFLTAANLNGLPPIFHEGANGLHLVAKQGDKYVPNVGAKICKEVHGRITREHQYGNKVTGKALELHFQGVGFGWERDILRVVLAVLLRGGSIEVTHQGRKYRNHHDPACRQPFTSTPAFRNASFAPREPLGLKLLANAATYYEEMTGKEVDIEEGAIAKAFTAVAADDREILLPLEARMSALGLPGADFVKEQLQRVQGIMEMPADDVVKTLAGEGKDYLLARQEVQSLAAAATDANINVLQASRATLSGQWDVLAARGAEDDLEEAAGKLQAALDADDYYDQLEAIRLLTERINKAYLSLYQEKHAERSEAYAKALDAVKGMPDWAAVSGRSDVSDGQRSALLAPLTSRCEHEVDLQLGGLVCRNDGASISQLETDTSVVGAIRDQVVREVQSLAAPEEKVERVRVSDVVQGRLQSKEDVEEAVAQLRNALLKKIAEKITVILE
jgi:hypothetical protein